VKGSTLKRCPCPVRRDDSGRRITCSKSHGSWSFKADGPEAGAGARRQVMKGGFPTRKAAEAALADYLSKAGRGELSSSDTRRLADYVYLKGAELSWYQPSLVRERGRSRRSAERWSPRRTHCPGCGFGNGVAGGTGGPRPALGQRWCGVWVAVRAPLRLVGPIQCWRLPTSGSRLVRLRMSARGYCVDGRDACAG